MDKSAVPNLLYQAGSYARRYNLRKGESNSVILIFENNAIIRVDMGRTQLVREAKRAALTRMEDAARTEQDFKQVVAQWNHLDKNRRRRERYNEVNRPNEEMLHWDKVNASDEKGKLRTGFGRVIPRPLEFQWWRQLIRGDFIDTMFDCPHELHELVADEMISPLLQDLSANHKEILYYSAVRLYSNVYIAAIRGQSDRNIRKTLALLRKICVTNWHR
jgi:hypothetical protein